VHADAGKAVAAAAQENAASQQRSH
jgi:hypothetical protein